MDADHIQCGVMHGSGQDGCILSDDHEGPHEYIALDGVAWQWETILECTCDWCMKCEGDYCTAYWRKADSSAEREYQSWLAVLTTEKTNQHRRRIVCAAIRAADGDVLLGIRHYSEDMHRQIEVRRDGEKFIHRHGDDQGFVDQRGVYLTREEAYRVALDANQIVRPHACTSDRLYSEGLY